MANDIINIKLTGTISNDLSLNTNNSVAVNISGTYTGTVTAPSVEGTKPGGNSGGSSSGGSSDGSSSVKDKLVTSIGQLDNTIKVQDVANGTELSELNLPKELSATVSGVANTRLGVTWTSTPAYIGTKAGTYTFNATLASGYKLLEGVLLPSITVKVSEAVVENETIKINDSEALKKALELQKDGQKNETKTTVDGYGEAIIADLSDGSKSATWGKASITIDKIESIVKAGWGSPEGFSLESAKTPVYLVGNQEGTYKVKIELVDLSNLNKVIAETIASVIVK